MKNAHCCRNRNRWLPIASPIIRCFGCILSFLLSEADFFVDEKDLQTFVGATSQSRFFFACDFLEFLLANLSGQSGRLEIRVSHHAPIFHYVVTCVHWGRQQVLPVISMPHGIEIENWAGGRLRCRVRGCLVERAAKPGGEAAAFIQ